MRKQFYSESDVDDLHARGVTRLQVGNQVVLTEAARERALQYGICLQPEQVALCPGGDAGEPQPAVTASGAGGRATDGGAVAAKLVYVATSGTGDRACLPFVLAAAAQNAGAEAVVALQSAGVFLAVKGYGERIAAPGGGTLAQRVADFLQRGGRLFACVVALQDRKIDSARLIAGAQVATADTVTAEILTAKSVLVY